MSDKKVFVGKTNVESENYGGIEKYPRSTPEEGRRLMHAFFSIRDANVRESIIRYVEKQLQLAKDG